MADILPDESPTFASAVSLFRPSLSALRRNLFTFFYLYSMPFLVAICGGVILAGAFHAGQPNRSVFFAAGGIALFASVLLLLVSLPGLTYTQLQSVRGETVDYFEALRAGRYYFWRLWGVRLCSSGLIALGFALLFWSSTWTHGAIFVTVDSILLILPGIFVLRRYFFGSYVLLDTNCSVSEALHESARLSGKYTRPTWSVLGVQLLLFACNAVPFAGTLVASLGNLTYYCAAAVRYAEVSDSEANLARQDKQAARKPGKKSRKAASRRAQARTKNKS